ncbi:MAG: hypothetical protein EHM50_09275 [Lysobacterales bacterium]|nr:MAG: hypothetical protein EHM50_09275 [Xanthomonadales bacterium]
MSQAFDLPRSGIRARGDGNCLMVMELGSQWPEWISRDAVCSLVLQGKAESASELASRAIREIGVLRSTRGELRTLVLAAGENLDEELFAARVMICRAAVASTPARKSSLLVFSGHERLSITARHELFSLAGALNVLLAGTRVGIAVKLCDEPVVVAPEQSGVFELGESAPRAQEVSS